MNIATLGAENLTADSEKALNFFSFENKQKCLIPAMMPASERREPLFTLKMKASFLTQDLN